MIVRTQSLAGEWVHVDEEDPALDREPDDWRDRYDRALELSDLAVLPLKSGQPPVLWRFRHLSADEVAWIVDRGTGSVTMNLDTLALALVGVTGVQDEHGKSFVLARLRDPQRNGFSSVKREQLDALLRDSDGRLDARRLGRLAGRVWSQVNPRNG
jgi:hypothetical protein